LDKKYTEKRIITIKKIIKKASIIASRKKKKEKLM